jgi:hypothetical protein
MIGVKILYLINTFVHLFLQLFFSLEYRTLFYDFKIYINFTMMKLA